MAVSLFTPLDIGGITLPNRIVVSPMCQYSADDGSMTDWHLQHLGTFACSGAGLFVVEATGVTPEGRITHGCTGLYSDRNESAFTENIKLARLRRARGDSRGALAAPERTLYITPFDPSVHDSVAVIPASPMGYAPAVRSRRRVGPAKVAHQHDASPVFQHFFQRWNCSTNTCIVCHFELFVKWYIKINADHRAFVLKVDAVDRFHGLAILVQFL
jgi:hypothetical protein